MADYIPNTDDALVTWLVNLKAKLPGYTGSLGIPVGISGAVIQMCDQIPAAIQAADQKKADWAAYVATKETLIKADLALLRGYIANWKTNVGMTPTIAAELQINSSAPAFDPNTYKASLTAEIAIGYVRLKFKKGQTDGITLYSRLQGQAAWKFVSRDTNSPYDDHTPVVAPGVAEVREYQAIAMLNDHPIGLPSDIVSVTVAG